MKHTRCGGGITWREEPLGPAAPTLRAYTPRCEACGVDVPEAELEGDPEAERAAAREFADSRDRAIRRGWPAEGGAGLEALGEFLARGQRAQRAADWVCAVTLARELHATGASHECEEWRTAAGVCEVCGGRA